MPRTESGTTDVISAPPPAYRRPSVVLVVIGLALLIGASLDILGISNALLVLVVLAVSTATYARHVGWILSFAGTLLAAFVLQTVFLLVTPLFPFSMAWSNLVAWTVVTAVHAIVLVRDPPRFGRARRDQLLAVLVVPIVLGAALIARALLSHGSWIGWGMRNDVVQKTLAARFIIEDDGLARANNDALTTVLDATWSSSVRAPVLFGEFVRHLVLGTEQVWLITWFLVAIAAGVIALRTTARATRAVRWAAITIVEVIPFTWYASGNSFGYGFQNASVACLLLVLAWLVWRDLVRRPAWVIPILVLAIDACGMAWVPLAVFPAALLLGACVRLGTGLFRMPRASWIATGAAIVLGGIFALGQSLPSLISSVPSIGGIFSVGGSIVAIDHWAAIAMFIVTLLAAFAAGRWLHPGTAAGLAYVIGCGAIVFTMLLSTRADQVELFSYYPVKFLWILSIACALIWIAELYAVVARFPAVVAVLVLVGFVPASFAVASNISPNRYDALYPGSIAAIVSETFRDQSAIELFGILNSHPRSIVTGYSFGEDGPDSGDFFLDFWLMQISVDRVAAPIRTVPYSFNPQDPVQVCRAIAIWGPGVTVYTSSPAQATAIENSCSPTSLRYRVLIRADVDRSR